jgi:uncharacterized protein YbjT (DUF2867 family)
MYRFMGSLSKGATRSGPRRERQTLLILFRDYLQYHALLSALIQLHLLPFFFILFEKFRRMVILLHFFTELRTITVAYTIEFARVLRRSSPEAAFSFLSGKGADPTGRSRMPFARYKGEAENALLAAGFPHVYVFRPAYIYPVEPRKEPNFTYRLMRAIYPAFRMLFPNQVIRADDLARAMVNVVIQKTAERETQVFENRDIRAMIRSFHVTSE